MDDVDDDDERVGRRPSKEKAVGSLARVLVTFVLTWMCMLCDQPGMGRTVRLGIALPPFRNPRLKGAVGDPCVIGHLGGCFLVWIPGNKRGDRHLAVGARLGWEPLAARLRAVGLCFLGAVVMGSWVRDVT